MAYLRALENGEIIEDNVDYALSEEELFEIIETSLRTFDISITLYKDDSVKDNYYFDIKSDLINEDSVSGTIRYYFAMKNSTPGGRYTLQNEQRIQVQAEPFKHLYQKNNGINSFLLGVYKGPNSEPIFCTWKSVDTTSTSTISKQIKIDTISAAYKYGFERQLKRDEFACAFRKEFFLFYIKNLSWIHDKQYGSADEFRHDSKDLFNLLFSKIKVEKERNRIIFGAPGTGKSFKLNKEKNELLKNGGEYERVTFHPDYSYANFVGTYKPVPVKDSKGEDSISYEYVPGPFMRTYVKAINNCLKSEDGKEKPKPYLLLIEEINRANTAAVFGDVFQLLDRKDNISEYPIQASEEMKRYLSKEIDLPAESLSEIRIPDNMFIWATMNSADQGVYPMDTAFKRRWEFEYLGIDESEKYLEEFIITLGKNKNSRKVEWNNLRKAINSYLTKQGINEDKLLGPFFINTNKMVDENGVDYQKFIDLFKNKIIMYLYEDAAKHRPEIFRYKDDSKKRYSEICEDFDKDGIFIFNDSIVEDLEKLEDLDNQDIKK